MEENTQPSLATNLIIVGEGAAPILLCPRHTDAMVTMLKTADVPFACYGLDSAPENAVADSALEPEDHMCQACDLNAELNRPRIILPD
jgi:hypothetical protein